MIPLLTGTLYLTAIGLVVAVPLGLLAAIYLSEYAPPRVRKVVKPVLELLAGVPTIVFGYFALDVLHARGAARRLRARRQPVQRARRPGSSSACSCCRRSRRSPRTRCRPCPQSLREGAFGARREQAAGLAARRVPGGALRRRRRARPRRLARRRRDRDHPRRRRPGRPTSGLDPRVGYQSMAAFIAATVARRHPDRLDQVRDDLRRRHGAVRDHAGAERGRRSGSSAATGRCTSDRRADRRRGAARGPSVLPRPSTRLARSPTSPSAALMFLVDRDRRSSASARSCSTSRATGCRGSRRTSSRASRRGSSRSAPASSRRSSGRST